MRNIPKILMWVLITVVIAFLFVLFVAGVVDAYIWIAGVLHVSGSLGITTQASQSYDSVSGSLPVDVAILGFSGFATAIWRHINCEQPGCWRPGHRHPDHGRPVCRKHYHHDVVPEVPYELAPVEGNCPIREHTGDGAPVGRCCFAIIKGECPRHGLLADYPNHDDRDIDVEQRRWPHSRGDQ